MARTKKTTKSAAEVEVPERKAPAVVQRDAQKKAPAKTPPPRVEEEELFEEEEIEEEDVEEEELEEEDPEEEDGEEEDDDDDADTPPDDEDEEDEEDDDDDSDDEEDLTEEVEDEEEEPEPEPAQVSLTWLTAEVIGDVKEPDRPYAEIDDNIRQIEAMKELMPDIAYRAAIDALDAKKQELSGVHVFLQENEDAARLEQSAVALALALHDTLQQIEVLTTAHNQRDDVGTHQRVTFSGIDLQVKPYNGEQGVGIEGGYEVYAPRAVRSSRTSRKTSSSSSRRGRGGNTRLGSYSVFEVYQYLVNNGQTHPVARHKYGGQYYYAILEGDRLHEAEYSNGKATIKRDGRIWDSFNQWVNEWHKSTNAWLRLELKLPDGAAKQRNYGWNTDDRGEPIVDADWQTDADRLRDAMGKKAVA